ncbi:MAG TPA: 30S ribosomal protein S8 [Patescibacteria group bacterium]|nr:30S ribosomal protein S8 [Patescibacteria group bacterium]
MDPIANMLTQIRNSLLVGQKSCLVRYSKIKEEILKAIKSAGYIKDYKIEEKNDRKNIRVILAYDHDNNSIITSIKRISKSGRRVYCTKDKLPYVLRGMGILVVSTSKGIMTDKSARKENIGGEIICEIY